MDRVGRYRLDNVADPPAHAKRQPDLGIKRTGHRAEQAGLHRVDAVAHRAEFAKHLSQGSHNAVHLRRPGVRREQNLHDRSRLPSAEPVKM
jgi:hypothetical protein